MLDHAIIDNGKCSICGKPLTGKQVFICEECQEKTQKQNTDCEFLELCIESYDDTIDRTKCDCEKCDHFLAFREGKNISLEAAWDV